MTDLEHVRADGRDPQVLALQTTLRAVRGFRSPAMGALLTLAILLGKALVCHHAPGRAVFFDAMLMVPISLLAYHEGLVTGLVAGLVASVFDLVVGARTAGLLIPAYLSSSIVRSIVITRLFSLEVVAAVVSTLSRRARRQMAEAQRRTKEYLKRISLLEEHNAAMERSALDKEAEFERDLLKYSSLLYLLEESAQKLSSNLEVERLFQTFFRVLEECFGSTCASIYLKDSRNKSYFLAKTSGADNSSGGAIPMMLRQDDLLVTELQNGRGAICWSDEKFAERLERAGRPVPAIISGCLVDKGELIGVVNIHAVDRRPQPDVMLMGMVCNIASIAMGNARLFEKVQWLAARDPLTKLNNRRTFHSELENQLARRAENAEQFALLMLDIDRFKSFNDTYGHQAGDAVLEWFAKHCVECAGEANPVFRYGGEEFTVIMPGADVQTGVRLAERMRRRIEHATFRYRGVDLQVRLSCGVAVFPDNGTDADELVRKADRALYRAKAAGRNTVAVSETTPGHDTAIVPYEVQMAEAAQAEDASAPAETVTAARNSQRPSGRHTQRPKPIL